MKSRGAPDREHPPLLTDRIFGFLGGSMILAALILLVTGGLAGEEFTLEGPPPMLELVAPTAADSIDGALELVFRTQAPLEPQPGGWGAYGLHIHAEINGIEIMPRVDDIRSGPGGTYVWTIGRAPSGEATVRVRWSDLQHRPVEEGASASVRVYVR